MDLAVTEMIRRGHRNLFYVKDADTDSGNGKKAGSFVR
jgi:hypothetical protein